MKKIYKLGKNGKAGNPFSSKENKAIRLFSTLFIAFLFMNGSLWAQHTSVHSETYPACPSPTNPTCSTAENLPVGPSCVQGTIVTAGTSCGTGSSVWFSFATDIGSTYTISTDNGAGDLLSDTWLQLFSGCNQVVPDQPCADDFGDCYSLAAQITFVSTQTSAYYVQVGAYAVGNFCINVVKNAVPSNDCISGATPIDALLSTDLNSCSTFAAETHIYRPHNAASIFANSDGPTASVVNGVLPEDIHCNGGLYPNNNGINSVFHDVWFDFTYNSSTMDASWLSVYPNDGCNFYVMNLFSGIPTGINICDTIDGLVYARCAVGDQTPLTCGNQGNGTNKSKNSFSNHPRLDLTGLEDGTKYYLRVSQFTAVLIGDTNLAAPPREGYFNLVIEAAPDLARVDIVTSDACPANATIDCGETYHCLSTAGMTGNIVECNMPPASVNEPLFYNNSAIYAFDVDTFSLCGADVTVDISNIAHLGVNGLGASFFLTNNCNGQVGFGGSSEFCETSLRFNGLVTPGRWYIIVNGDRGNLVSYDLQVNIDYFLLSALPLDAPCLNVDQNLDTLVVDDCPATQLRSAAGIAEQTASDNFKLNVSPVPSSDKVAISYTVGNDAPTTIDVYNMIGEKVYSAVVISVAGIEGTHTIDISSFTSGTYIINLVNNNERTHAKMVKVE
jgi:hypothetical protein